MADEQIEIESLIKIWKEFADKSKDFKLNSDEDWVRKLAIGVLNNEQKYGLKFCPCRISTKNIEKDLKLICPCNFKAQKTWQEKGECWCGLFFKK